MAYSSEISNSLSKRLSQHRLFYVCRDIERAFVPNLDLKSYYIITNTGAFSTTIAKKNKNIILIKNKQPLDTADLLQQPETKKKVKPGDFILVFKNNAIIETVCKKNKWKLLNPSAELADTVEGKVSQVTWLHELAKFLPPHTTTACAKVQWQHKKFILQFNHSHTGSGTFLIDSRKKLAALQEKFPNRLVRIMDYINGPVFTNNNVVWNNHVLIGNISYQITGLAPFTHNTFTTIGNDWALPYTLLNDKQVKQYNHIVNAVGEKLQKGGWKGLFGIDVIADKKTGTVYLLEINARQPASATFESQLQQFSTLSFPQQRESSQQTNRFLTKSGMTGNTTIFEAHLAALLNLPPKNYTLIKINNGAQIVQRVTSKTSKLSTVKIKNPAIIQTIKYKNTNLNADLLRIQLKYGIMKGHTIFNTLGKTIATSIC